MSARLYEFPRPERGGQDADVAQGHSDDILGPFLSEGAALTRVALQEDERARQPHDLESVPLIARRVSLAIWIASALAALTLGVFVWSALTT